MSSACPACTFLNEPNWRACAMCGGANPVPPSHGDCPSCGRAVAMAVAEAQGNQGLLNLQEGAPSAPSAPSASSHGAVAGPALHRPASQANAGIAAGATHNMPSGDAVDLTDSYPKGAGAPPPAPVSLGNTPLSPPTPHMKTLTSQQQVELLRQTLILQPTSRPAEVVDILRRIRGHIEAEEREERDEEAKGAFIWEFKRGSRWIKFSEAVNITIEAERRAGRPTAQFQDKTGITIEVDFQRMRDSRGMAIQAQPAPVDHGAESKSSSSSSSSALYSASACAVCMEDFLPAEGGVAAFTSHGCGHRVLCTTCMQMYLKQKIDDSEIFPWISCPAAGCDMRLSADHIFSGLGRDLSAAKKLAKSYLQKWIVRYPEWSECAGADCSFGFMVSNSMEGKRLHCGVCNKRQTVKRKVEERDEGLMKMIQDGTLRPCPKCDLLP